MPLHHCITMSPCYSVICLAPVTKPASNLTCPLLPNQSVIWLALYHCITASPCCCISQSFALPAATKPVSHLPCPLPPCHHMTTSPHHCITMSPHHCVTVLVSHLPCPLPPNQSVICLAPCHQTSQSFDLPSTTMSLHHHVTMSPHHRITASLHHCIITSPQHCSTMSPHHHVTMSVSHLPCPLQANQSVICLAPCQQTSQSFALPPATKPVSHLTCPLPPCHCITTSPHHCITASPHHRVIAAPHHCSTANLHHCITTWDFPLTWVWIWLVNTTQHSSDWLIVPTTANQISGIEKPNYHKTLIFFPTTTLKRSHEVRIDELADSNEPAMSNVAFYWRILLSIFYALYISRALHQQRNVISSGDRPDGQ